MRNFLLNLSRDKRTTIMISSHILSEIEQMADTIGVMHEGKVIEEIRMEELRKRNRHYIEFGFPMKTRQLSFWRKDLA
jgi:ABC-type multidrug transport system ATPase subunit